MGVNAAASLPAPAPGEAAAILSPPASLSLTAIPVAETSATAAETSVSPLSFSKVPGSHSDGTAVAATTSTADVATADFFDLPGCIVRDSGNRAPFMNERALRVAAASEMAATVKSKSVNSVGA